MAIVVIDNDISAEIHKNIADENDAIKGYYELRKIVTDPDDTKSINGIIEEELKHVRILTKMLDKYTNIKAEK